MITNYLLHKHQIAINKIEQFTSRKNWQIELTLIIPFVVLFFSFPSYEWMFDKDMSNWRYIIEQATNPFKQSDYDPGSHQAKLTFRLLIPLLLRFFHLNIFCIIILQILIGVLMIYFFIKIILLITNNKTVAVLLTFAYASTAICKCSFNDILGYLDSFALFFLIIPFVTGSSLLIFIGVFFAAWVDERGLIASCLIFIWVLFFSNKNATKIFAVLLAWVAYFSIRLFIENKYNLVTHTDAVGLSMLINQINNAPLGIWTGLEGFWLLVILSFLVLIKQDKKMIAFLFFGGISIIALVALSVSDITRSMIYLFPSIFIALRILKNVETEKNLIYIATFVLLLCAIFPMLTVGGYNSVNWQYPLPLQLLRYLGNYLMS